MGPPPATPASELKVPAGFKAELIYSVPRGDQGSWVCLALDPKGRLIAGDQYGGLYRITVPPLGTSTGAKVELLTENIGGAQGLLYAFDSLYVMVNQRNERGVWRLRDTDNDDQFDDIKLIRVMNGTGEHGTHALVLSPDGKSIYFGNGNFTDLPKNWEHARPTAWGEDHLLPRMWDARGHARGKLAPGGYIGRMNPDGSNVDIVTIGFRNQYDFAFDQNGEIFTYDSDMEWDQGSPWYVPTRIVHATGGADFGWRSGAGRWPDYYADSLPAAVNIGPGSPTGVTFGTNAKFPAKYQRAFFANDWTYGTMYAIHPSPAGSTFRGEKEEFVTGKPLPLTDVVINPHDGAMYFAVGGRRTQSALYRITYTGSESTAPAAVPPPTPEAQLRRSLEALHQNGTGREAIDTAWPHLAHTDRFVRFAARVAVEKQPAATWADRALSELRPQAAIEALIALARVGDKALQPRLIESLSRLDYRSLSTDQRLGLLRAWQLAFTRMGKPSPEACATIAAKLEPLFPTKDAYADRELANLLIFLDSPTAVAKIVPLLSVAETPDPDEFPSEALLARNDRYGPAAEGAKASRPDRQQISLAYALRNATTGWTPELRKQYFAWFPRTAGWRGGASFGGFIKNIRAEALGTVADPAEKAALEQSSVIPVELKFANATPPKGPGRNYTLAEAVSLVEGQLRNRNFQQGRAMYNASACSACHRFAGEGIAQIGPDISGAGKRYNVRDLLENIIEPSAVISDQYGSEEFERIDGTKIVGRVMAAENNGLVLMTNPMVPDDQTRVMLSDIKTRKPFTTSMMPPGLINALNADELRDLVAYLLSGGNPNDPMFRR
jgi:putative heme-binding domain-containing protein